MEKPFEKINGVLEVTSGYTGGPEVNPNYEQVATGKTGHTESVQIAYGPLKITYAQLLDVFWKQIDPTDVKGQFVDRGIQYRPGIFYHNKIQEMLVKKTKNKKQINPLR